MPQDTSRRTFLKNTAVAGAAVTVGGAVSAVALGEDAEPEEKKKKGPKAFKVEAVDDKVTLTLADHSALSKENGALKLKVKKRGKMLAVRLSGDEYLAISSKCTHQGCQVNWVADKKMFQCPCHDSAFDLEGKPTGGPAEDPLTVFPLEAKDGVLTITLPPK